jgi:hypothetical protein
VLILCNESFEVDEVEAKIVGGLLIDLGGIVHEDARHPRDKAGRDCGAAHAALPALASMRWTSRMRAHITLSDVALPAPTRAANWRLTPSLAATLA